MDRRHAYTIGLLLSALAAQIGMLKTWADAKNPLFVAACLLSIGAALKAMFQDPLTGVVK